ncbi:MAG: SUMF1/EgtB/PvdO family nonheme iron enzyme [Deltaproteobacteria bacterium]|nr:SUMF1/EgtB/PvdO family nonheme iron enzyme [Deltaproteobacteria bacterium]
MRALLLPLLLAAACGGGERGPFRREPDRTRMVTIAASTFSMGHPVEAPGDYGQAWKEIELPAHEVSLPDYLIDQDEVTVAEYAEFLNDAGGEAHHAALQAIAVDGGRYLPAAGAAALPIAQVSFFDAATFCAWAGKRLPTEAEWERAARGPAGLPFPWGEDWPSCDQAVFFTGGVFCADGPLPVGGRSPQGDSAEGVHDLAGNVAEWTQDGLDRYSSDPQVSPRGPSTSRYRVVRGGGFHSAPASLRGSARLGARPEHRSEEVGFRCAL